MNTRDVLGIWGAAAFFVAAQSIYKARSEKLNFDLLLARLTSRVISWLNASWLSDLLCRRNVSSSIDDCRSIDPELLSSEKMASARKLKLSGLVTWCSRAGFEEPARL